ncbi:alpha/beta hydrolase [Niveibacterium sp. 24ML]|uniref:alpha/beta family hydrolase n=1 Tax=Niveibacterium sp. 24ML TaxID=2985512 RepID=UPI0022714C5E|nr:alpha/beta family hydrolase [Niveibacterium sp. 24ML]MCX9155976.1 alpha/beta hydrolase [Niveibacterium sp. 24ML]
MFRGVLEMAGWIRVCVGALLALQGVSALALETAIVTPRGARVSMLVDVPDGAGPFPAIVIAPGQGYHMRLPLMAQSAERLRAAGVLVYRFDWAYRGQPGAAGEPSEGLLAEAQDLSSVIDAMRKDARANPKQLFIAGKSMGSVVAWRVMRTQPDLRAGAFLTPICSDEKDGRIESAAEENYPHDAQHKRPTLFLAGDQDPLCAPSVLYRYAASLGGRARVAVVAGNHSLAVPADEPASAANLDLATHSLVRFVADQLKR